MRHGQSEWNRLMTETGRDPGLADPPLTEQGETQARSVVAKLGKLPIRRIIASPYRRALQTATPIADALGLTIEVSLYVRERKAYSCDVGSPASVIAAEWPHLDFSHLPEIWWPAADESHPEVSARAREFRTHIHASEDWDNTMVVSHWGFLLGFTGVPFENGEWRKLEQQQ